MYLNRICKYCGNEFVARTTQTKYCSHKCSQRSYKARVRNVKKKKSDNQTFLIRNKPIIDVIAKEFLTVKDTALLLNISTKTIYRLIEKGTIKAIRLSERKVLVKRTDIDKEFTKDYKPAVKKVKPIPPPEIEYYTYKEIEQIYNLSKNSVWKIIKKQKIPTIMRNNKLHIDKIKIDRYFKRTRKDVSHITEWYSVQDVVEKYNVGERQVHRKVYEKKIPKRRDGRFVYLSKSDIDKVYSK